MKKKTKQVTKWSKRTWDQLSKEQQARFTETCHESNWPSDFARAQFLVNGETGEVSEIDFQALGHVFGLQK